MGLNLRSTAESVTRLLLAYAAVMAVFGFVSLSLRAAGVVDQVVPMAAAGAALVFLAGAWYARPALTRRAVLFLDRIATVPGARWWWGCAALGLALRVTWALLVGSQPSSDGATYLSLAKGLLAGQDYRAGDTRAYWPPGYTFFLMPWLAVLESDRVAIVVSNLTLFVLGFFGVRFLACQSGDAGVARLAVLLLAVWPNLIAQVVTPEKEQLLVALFPWMAGTAVAAVRGRLPRAAVWAAICGLVLGAVNLTQPAFVLFPFLLAAYWALATRQAWRTLVLCLALIAGAASAIAPWSLRNLQVLGQFVLISTNGGVGLYGANNPRASGGYFEFWADDDLTSLDELSADREGRTRALDWIRSHPRDVLGLAFEKNLRFMGDDAAGVFQSLKRGGGTDSAVIYGATKLYANLFWLAFWSAALATLLARWRRDEQLHAVYLLVSASFLYGFALHSLAESAGKYHVYAIGVLCVLLPLIARMTAPPTISRV